MRYNANLSEAGLQEMGLKDLDADKVRKMDSVKYISDLEMVGEAASKQIHLNHFGSFV